jgi:hypothetical protein
MAHRLAYLSTAALVTEGSLRIARHPEDPLVEVSLSQTSGL